MLFIDSLELFIIRYVISVSIIVNIVYFNLLFIIFMLLPIEYIMIDSVIKVDKRYFRVIYFSILSIKWNSDIFWNEIYFGYWYILINLIPNTPNVMVDSSNRIIIVMV